MVRWVWITIVVATAGAGAATPADQLYRQARAAEAEQSWDRAALLFGRLAERYPDDPRAVEAEYRAIVARLHCGYEQRSLAEPALGAFALRHAGTVWALHAQRLLLERAWHPAAAVRTARWRALARGYEEHFGDRRTLADRQTLADAWSRVASDAADERPFKIADVEAAVEAVVRQRLPDRTIAALQTLASAYRAVDPSPVPDRWVAGPRTMAVWRRILAEYGAHPAAAAVLLDMASDALHADRRPLARTRLLEFLRRYPQHQAAAQVRQSLLALQLPSVSLDCGGTHLPGARLPWRLSVTNARGVRLRLVRLNLDQWADGAADVATQPVLAWRVGVVDRGDYATQTLSGRLQPLPPGVYRLTAVVEPLPGRRPPAAPHRPGSSAMAPPPDPAGEVDDWPPDWEPEADPQNATLFVVSRLVAVADTVATLSADESTVAVRVAAYVVDRLTRRPVPDCRIACRTTSTERATVRWRAQGRSDGQGRARLVFTLPDSDEDEDLVLLARQGDDVARVDCSSGWFDSEKDWEPGYCCTDRPLYRPGDRVRYRAILRQRRDDGRWEPVAPGPVWVRLGTRAADNARVPAQVDAAGEVSGELVLPADASGDGGLTVERDGPAGTRPTVLAEAGFSVTEYRKPSLAVEIGEPRTPPRAGEPLLVPIRARYYHGAPVVGARVRWSAEGRTQWVQPPGAAPAWWPPAGWLAEDVAWHSAAGFALTDPDGEAVITVPTPAERSLVLSIHASVTELGRETVGDQRVISVPRQGLFLFPELNAHVVEPGDRVELRIVAGDGAQRPVATPLTVALHRRSLRPHPADPAADLCAYVRGPEVWRRELTTDADGRATLVVPAPEDGDWELVVSAPDPADPRRSVESWIGLWCSTGARRGLTHDTGNLELRVSQVSPSVGDTLRVLLRSPVADAPVLLQVVAGGVAQERLVPLLGHAAFVDLPVDETWVPNVSLSARQVGTRGVYSAEAALFVRAAAHELAVAVTAAPTVCRPGEEARVAVQTALADGRPTSARVSLGLVDEALLALYSPARPSIHDWFWRRYVRFESGTEDSLEYDGEYDEEYLEQIAPGEHEPAYRPQGWLEGQVVAGAGDYVGVPDACPEACRVSALRNGGGGPRYRQHFADTAFWQPDVQTGADGRAEVTVTLPDNATTWRATAVAATPDTRVGEGRGTLLATKDLVVDLRTPRFLVVGDEGLVSAVVSNRTDRALAGRVELETSGPADLAATKPVELPANGQALAEELVRPTAPGTLTVAAAVTAGELHDGLQLPCPVIGPDLEQSVAVAGECRADGRVAAELALPAAAQPGTAKLVVTASPSLVGSLLDGLPDLLGEPSECVETTVSRLGAARAVARAIGYVLPPPPPRRATRPVTAYAAPPGGPPPIPGVEVPPPDPGVDPPAEPPPPQVPTAWAKRGLADLDALQSRLTWQCVKAQNADGGFGWYRGFPSDPRLTAYAAWALRDLRDEVSGVDRETRLHGYLLRALPALAGSGDTAMWVAWSLSQRRDRLTAAQRATVAHQVRLIHARRERLTDSTRALLVMVLRDLDDPERAGVAWRNLLAHRQVTAEGVHWGGGSRWGEAPAWATALALQAALRLDPRGGVAGEAARWLAANRQGRRWGDTWTTALAIEALAGYARATGETTGAYRASLTVNGQAAGEWQVTAANRLEPGPVLTVEPAHLRPGANQIAIRREGRGGLYYTAQLTWVGPPSTTATAGRLTVERRLHRLIGEVGRVERRPLAAGESVAPGDLLEVELRLRAANQLSYVTLTDRRPAGCEPAEQRSGCDWDDVWLFREVTDQGVVLHLPEMPAGETVVRHRLRASWPGNWQALPVTVTARYRSDLATQSVGERLHIRR